MRCVRSLSLEVHKQLQGGQWNFSERADVRTLTECVQVPECYNYSYR